MSEQARAVVRAWQETVEAAWQQQSTLLAGGVPVQSEVDVARAAYFGPAGPGSQRQVLQTGAVVPGGRDGIIVSRFYIANPGGAFGTLHGDGRGPTTDPAAGHRFSIAWDTRTGELSLTVNSSTVNNAVFGGPLVPSAPDPVVPGAGPGPVTTPLPDTVVPALPITTLPGGGDNNFVVDQAGPDHLRVSYNVVNSVYQLGQANGAVDIALAPDNITVRLEGDDYPDSEFIQHTENGSRILATKPMSFLEEGAVFPGVDQVDHPPWIVPR